MLRSLHSRCIRPHGPLFCTALRDVLPHLLLCSRAIHVSLQTILLDMLLCLSFSGGSSPPGLVEVDDDADSAALVRQAVLSFGDMLKRVTPAAPGALSDWAIQCTETEQLLANSPAKKRTTRVISRDTTVRTILGDPPDPTKDAPRSFLRLVYLPNAVRVRFMHVPQIPDGTTHTLYLAAEMTVADIIDVLTTEIGLRKVVSVGHRTSRVDYRLQTPDGALVSPPSRVLSVLAGRGGPRQVTLTVSGAWLSGAGPSTVMHTKAADRDSVPASSAAAPQETTGRRPRSLFGFVPGEQERAATKTLQDGTASATWNRLSSLFTSRTADRGGETLQRPIGVAGPSVRQRTLTSGGTSASSNEAEDLNAESEAGMVRLSSFWRLCLLMTK